MRKKLIVLLGLGLLASANLKAQTAQDFKQTYADLAVFEDPLALTLKKGIKKKQLNQIADTTLRRVAQAILDGNYNKDYKYATYYALLNPITLGHQLSIGDGYSKYENMTGVYLPKGKHIVIVDGIAAGKEVNLVVPNWLRKAPNPQEPTKDPKGWGLEKQEFRLQNGVNIIQLDDYGSLAYIDYFSEEPEKENPIRVHFPTGQVNGYFDLKKQGNKEWDSLIDHAVFPIMDAKGEYIQTAYPIEALKQYAYGKGVELIRNYDSLVYRQHRLMGLEKYNKVPKNRILARVNYNYYMFRDGDGVAYMGDKVGYAMKMVVTPESVIKGDPCWGFSHEVGHVHQTRPMFNWGGLGEVSNNLFSLYVTRSFGNKTRVSEQNNFEKAKANIIEKRISYLSDPDVFDRLIPFWQLQLYFESEGKRPDFYADLFEAFRQQNMNKARRQRSDWSSDRMMGERNPAVHQLNFVKTACEVAKLDLTDFFDKYGFFFVGTLEYDDYGKYTYTMTQEMVDACRLAIKNMNLPKPKADLTVLRD